MEDQGKRLFLAVAIAFGIMMAWSFLFPPKKSDEETEKKKKAESAELADSKGTDGAAVAPGDKPSNATGSDPAGDSRSTETPSVAKPPLVRRGPARKIALEFPEFRAVFTTHGGALQSWELKGERFEDRAAGDGRQIDLVPTGRANFADGAVDDDMYPLLVGFEPVKDVTSYVMPAKTSWTVEKETKTSVDFVWSSDELRIRKRFTIDPTEMLVKMVVEVKNISTVEARESLRVTSFAYQNPKDSTGGGWTRIDRSWRVSCYVDGELETNSAKYLTDKGPQNHRGNVRWFGTTHAYFLAAIAAKQDSDSRSRCRTSVVEGAPLGTMRVDYINGPPVKLGPGQFYARTFVAYFGPKYLSKLDGTSAAAGFDTGFEHAIDLGFFEVISRPLLWLLQVFHGVVGNWGIAIILLTLVVKLATIYWTTKSMRSMRAMAKLKPKVDEIQKKYKGDRQRTQVEIMGLYKTHKVSPLSGCLPMVLQMPIWFALYRTLRVAAELFQAPFVPGWIDDMTSPDPYYVLPVALMVMMFLQAKLSPTTADSTQQKMMQYGLPMVFGVMGFMFPAGLTLYIFTNTGLTALHNLWMNKTDKDPAPVVAAAAGSTSGRKGSAKNQDMAPELDVIDVADADVKTSNNPATSGAGKKNSSGKKRSGNKGKKRKRGSR